MGARIEFPLFALLFEDASGTVFLQGGGYLFLPLFSSVENAVLYAKRDSLACSIVEFETAMDLAGFLRSPPARGTVPLDFHVMMDPISHDTREAWVFDRQQLIADLEGQ